MVIYFKGRKFDTSEPQYKYVIGAGDYPTQWYIKYDPFNDIIVEDHIDKLSNGVPTFSVAMMKSNIKCGDWKYCTEEKAKSIYNKEESLV